MDFFEAEMARRFVVAVEKIANALDRKTDPKTCQECEHWNDTEDGCADRHGCKTEPTGYNMSPVEDEPQKERSSE